MIFLCGHYEGIDERVLEEIVTDYISIGDYVLTGGELPAMVLIDAVSRLVPGCSIMASQRRRNPMPMGFWSIRSTQDRKSGMREGCRRYF